MTQKKLTELLFRASEEHALTQKEAERLLSLKDVPSIHRVMSAACNVRKKHFGEKLFLYGFIYFSTYCRNHCAFCFYRKTNTQCPRYRKSPGEVLRIACRLADSGVHLVDLTMGEDPLMHSANDFDILFQMIQQIKAAAGLAVMVSPGVVPAPVLETLASINTDWYALYQETHNPELFRKLRTGQPFEKRMALRDTARRLGMLVEDGILLGVGETEADRAESVMAMKKHRVHQARVMSFIPQTETPLADNPSPPRLIEYLGIAVMRLLMPDRLIPASLDVDGIEGLRMRLNAGANVVTSIIPPSQGLAGVSQSTLDIEQGLRTVPEVKKLLSGIGLSVASEKEYRAWMNAEKEKTLAEEDHFDENRYRGWAAAGSGSGLSRQSSGI